MTSSVIHGRGMARLRRMRGWTVAECAGLAGVPVEQWRSWEDGRAWPTEPVMRWVLGAGREALMRLGEAEPENV